MIIRPAQGVHDPVPFATPLGSSEAAATLRPSIEGIRQQRRVPATSISQQDMVILHNSLLQASSYPLKMSDGLYFSEVTNSPNPVAGEYRQLVQDCLRIIARRVGSDGIVDFVELQAIGQELQQVDLGFSAERIGVPLDVIHQLVGPNPKHPYAKITVCRTVVPVRLTSKTVTQFFYEKFLVCYCYLDETGIRRPTTTPVHSHPLNFETIYFAFGDKPSQVTETEYLLYQPNGRSVLQPDGSLDPYFVTCASQGTVSLDPRPGPNQIFLPDAPIRSLPPFRVDVAFQNVPELLNVVDGYFRPHRVEVIGDTTRYFALDNYFSPTGRVILFADTGKSIWSHDDWVPR